VIDFDTNDFEYLQALVVEEYMAEFLEDLAEEEANLAWTDSEVLERDHYAWDCYRFAQRA